MDPAQVKDGTSLVQAVKGILQGIDRKPQALAKKLGILPGEAGFGCINNGCWHHVLPHPPAQACFLRRVNRAIAT